MKNFVISPEIKALIFDCDGTLADTMPLHYEAYLVALGDDARHFTEKMFYDQAGVPAVQVMEILKETHNLSFDPKTMGHNKERLFGEMLGDELKSVTAVETIARENYGKYPMAVASGGTRANVERILKLLDLTDLFETIVPAEEVAHGKPAPDMFLEAARRLGVEPTACLVFEDGEKGFEAAEAAGMGWVDVRPWYDRRKDENP